MIFTIKQWIDARPHWIMLQKNETKVTRNMIKFQYLLLTKFCLVM